MLDIKYIRENREAVIEAARNKNSKVDIVELLELDKERVGLLQEVEQLKSLKNDINVLIRDAQSDEERSEVIQKGKEIKEKIDIKEPQLREIELRYEELMRMVPNMPSDDTPVGKDEGQNVVLRTVGDIPRFDFEPKQHWELGATLQLIDTEHASRISGSRFAYLKGDLVLLQFALIQFALSTLSDQNKLQEIADNAGLKISSKPFLPVVPPVMIKPEPFEKMARLEPKDERYYIPQDDAYLIGSAEHTLGAMHMNETVPEGDAPIRYMGYSTSFRREAGSYGKDMKGIFRLHQFDKLEMESFTIHEHAIDEQNFFVAIQEYLMQQLEIPYQIVICCTGDMGDPDARHFDLEAWMPGQDKYRETHSADLMNDYQSRRLQTRIRRNDGSIEYASMNDATVFAIGRTLIAIMENYQQKDGTIRIPSILQSYVGKMIIGA